MENQNTETPGSSINPNDNSYPEVSRPVTDRNTITPSDPINPSSNLPPETTNTNSSLNVSQATTAVIGPSSEQTSIQPAMNTPIVSSPMNVGGKTSFAKRNVLLYALIGVIVVVIAVVGILALTHKGPFTNTAKTAANSNSALTGQPTELINSFVYDITHNKASDAYSLTIPGTGIQAKYTSSGFASNVRMLTGVLTGKAKATGKQNTSKLPDSKGQELPTVEAFYSITSAHNKATLEVYAIQANSKWYILSAYINPDSGDFSGIFDGSVGGYSSSSSDTAGSSTASASSTVNTTSCSAASGLTCYNVSASGSIPAFLVLFLPNLTEQDDDGNIYIFSPSGGSPSDSSQSTLEFSTVDSYTEHACGSGFTYVFTFTSNGSSEEACSLSGSIDTFANVNVGGTVYFVTIKNPTNSSPISTSTLETILSSFKAN